MNIEKNYHDFMKICDGIFQNPDEIFSFLFKKGYFFAPASSRFHGSFEGGLFKHSIEVANELQVLTKNMHLEWSDERSPVVIGLFHDLCKMDEYEEVEGIYQRRKDMLLTGHGEKSVILAQQFMHLTNEEILCIRYHMGAFEHDDISSYSNAVKVCENVLWTHTADMVASQVVGI